MLNRVHPLVDQVVVVLGCDHRRKLGQGDFRGGVNQFRSYVSMGFSDHMVDSELGRLHHDAAVGLGIGNQLRFAGFTLGDNFFFNLGEPFSVIIPSGLKCSC